MRDDGVAESQGRMSSGCLDAGVGVVWGRVLSPDSLSLSLSLSLSFSLSLAVCVCGGTDGGVVWGGAACRQWTCRWWI